MDRRNMDVLERLAVGKLPLTAPVEEKYQACCHPPSRIASAATAVPATFVCDKYFCGSGDTDSPTKGSVPPKIGMTATDGRARDEGAIEALASVQRHESPQVTSEPAVTSCDGRGKDLCENDRLKTPAVRQMPCKQCGADIARRRR